MVLQVFTHPGQGMTHRDAMLAQQLGQADARSGRLAAVHLHVADHHDGDAVVRHRRPEVGQHLPQEREVRLPVVGVVQLTSGLYCGKRALYSAKAWSAALRACSIDRSWGTACFMRESG